MLKETKKARQTNRRAVNLFPADPARRGPPARWADPGTEPRLSGGAASQHVTGQVTCGS